MLNRVILMGRLCADPELKTTVSGVSVTNFRIAVERSYKKEGEERKADFIDVVCWRQTAEFVCRYFAKGALIALEGELQTRSYKAKDGTNRYVIEVVASNVSFTGEREHNPQTSPQQNGYNNGYNTYNYPTPEPAPQQYAPQGEQMQMDMNAGYDEDDDLPFDVYGG